MSKWIVDIHGDIEGDYEIIKEYEEPKSGVQILEELKQLDYELYIRTQGYSHLTEEQWDWLIDNFNNYKKNMSEMSDVYIKNNRQI